MTILAIVQSQKTHLPSLRMLSFRDCTIYHSSEKLVLLLKVSMEQVNPLHTTGLFQYPPKTLENQSFLMFSGCIERDQWHEMV